MLPGGLQACRRCWRGGRRGWSWALLHLQTYSTSWRWSWEWTWSKPLNGWGRRHQTSSAAAAAQERAGAEGAIAGHAVAVAVGDGVFAG